MAEREPAGGIDERLRVGQLERAQARRTAQVDEEARGLGGAEPSRAGSSRKARVSRCVVEARRRRRSHVDAPAEAGDAVALHALGERPQLVEPERLRGPGDELLAHAADHRRGRPRQVGFGG